MESNITLEKLEEAEKAMKEFNFKFCVFLDSLKRDLKKLEKKEDDILPYPKGRVSHENN